MRWWLVVGALVALTSAALRWKPAPPDEEEPPPTTLLQDMLLESMATGRMIAFDVPNTHGGRVWVAGIVVGFDQDDILLHQWDVETRGFGDDYDLFSLHHIACFQWANGEAIEESNRFQFIMRAGMREV